MRKIIYPGTGWDTESVISGFIKVRKNDLLEESWQTIQAHEFDEVYPFTNIFWCGSPAAYNFPVIGMAGSYKQIEEDWNEWLWKFSLLLSKLDAIEAHVNLSCVLMGDYHWKLEPRARFENPHSQISMIGQIWGITDSPEPDFSTDKDWNNYIFTMREGRYQFDEKTDEWLNEWTQFVERWTKLD